MRAGVYVRQSLSLQLGIDRQLDRCRALIQARGWTRVREYIDNDVSASKPRGAKTEWHSLIEDAKARRIDTVVAVDLDRLIRTQRDLLTLIDLGLKVVTVDGDIDLTTAEGTFRATLATALARFEVQRKSERQKRAIEKNRADGRPAPGPRVFGYTSQPEGHLPFEPEATAVREAFTKIASMSMGQIARDWNAQGLTNTRSAPWRQQAVRGILSNPRYAGKIPDPRERDAGAHPARYDPLKFTEGSWEPLVPFELWLAARRYLLDPTRVRKRSDANKKLLIGSALCAVCGGKLGSGNNSGTEPTYRCFAGHIQIRASKIDAYVSEIIVTRLSEPNVRRDLAKRQSPDVERELLVLGDSRQRILRLVAQGSTTMREATRALGETAQRIRVLENKLIASDTLAVVSPIIDGAGTVGENWSRLPIQTQRIVVRTLLTVILRGTGRGRGGRDVAEYAFIAWK